MLIPLLIAIAGLLPIAWACGRISAWITGTILTLILGGQSAGFLEFIDDNSGFADAVKLMLPGILGVVLDLTLADDRIRDQRRPNSLRNLLIICFLLAGNLSLTTYLFAEFGQRQSYFPAFHFAVITVASVVAICYSEFAWKRGATTIESAEQPE